MSAADRAIERLTTLTGYVVIVFGCIGVIAFTLLVLVRLLHWVITNIGGVV